MMRGIFDLKRECLCPRGEILLKVTKDLILSHLLRFPAAEGIELRFDLRHTRRRRRCTDANNK